MSPDNNNSSTLSTSSLPSSNHPHSHSHSHSPMTKVISGSHHRKSTSEDLSTLHRMRVKVENDEQSQNSQDQPQKPKRKRITPEQFECLTSLFEQTDTPSFEIREKLSAKLNMTNREIQVWFQNRRAKVNRQRANEQNAQQQQQRLFQNSNGRFGGFYTFVPGWNHRNQSLISESNNNDGHIITNEHQHQHRRGRGHSRHHSLHEPHNNYSSSNSLTLNYFPQPIRPAPYSPRSPILDPSSSCTSPTLSSFSVSRGHHQKSQSLNIPSPLKIKRSNDLPLSQPSSAASFSPLKSPTHDFTRLSINSPHSTTFPIHLPSRGSSFDSIIGSKLSGGSDNLVSEKSYIYSPNLDKVGQINTYEEESQYKQEKEKESKQININTGIDSLMEAANTSDATNSLMALANSGNTSTPHTLSSATATPSPILANYQYEYAGHTKSTTTHFGIDMLASAAEYLGKMEKDHEIEENSTTSSSPRTISQSRWRPWD